MSEPDERVPESLSRREDMDVLSSSIEFYSRSFEMDDFIRRNVLGSVTSTLWMDGFLPRPSLSSTRWQELPELRMVYMAPDPDEGFNNFFDISSLAYIAGTDVSESLGRLFPMGPIRETPQRWYMFTGTSPSDVGYRGDHLPDLLYRRPEYRDKANAWLSKDKLDIGYELRVRRISKEDVNDLFELRLIDAKRDGEVEVALSDVGFGISQILPFLVQSLASEDRIISIEQPEVHIHPRLQADLGDLIAEGIKKPHNHQYLIETHSEHLILRIQKLIRKGDLEPSDVSVLYVSRGPKGSTVDRIRLDPDGEFIDVWPGGFFPERLDELR
jgi:hypothetical protein